MGILLKMHISASVVIYSFLFPYIQLQLGNYLRTMKKLLVTVSKGKGSKTDLPPINHVREGANSPDFSVMRDRANF